MGMALVGAHAYPQWSDMLLSISIAATVVFEIAGPILINMALDRTQEQAR
jgi:hypothetical protein